MKELSIEEKAKAYDEAIERAKKVHNEQRAQPFDVMLKVFPELKESEDVKIKSDIQFAVRCAFGDKSEQTNKILAWLEKQAERKSYASETMNEKGDFDSGFTRMMEREQKLAWSEEDEKYWSIIIAEFSKCAGKSVSKDEWMRCNDWLNSLRDRVLVQLPPKQEWSEEDERLFQIIIDILDKEEHKGHLSHTDLIACVRKLKSLRPQKQWKPSEEQIKILNEVLSFAANHESPYWNDYIFGTLSYLIRQLKKLRGK